MKRKKVFKMMAIIITSLIAIGFIFAKYKHISPIVLNMHKKINQAVFSDEAIEGYDPVAYFTQQKAMKGEKIYSYKWNDATWYFASAQNMNLFKSNPEKYAPQFGGYCSYAVSTGFTAMIDPEAWQIINGKLYLYNDQNFKSKWNEYSKENAEKDIKNWTKIK